MDHRLHFLAGQRLDRFRLEPRRLDAVRRILNLEFGRRPCKERGQEHVHIAYCLAGEWLAVTSKPSRFVLCPQPGEVAPDAMCSHCIDRRIARPLDPGAVAPVAFVRGPRAEALSRLGVEKPADGGQNRGTWRSAVPRRTPGFRRTWMGWFCAGSRSNGLCRPSYRAPSGSGPTTEEPDGLRCIGSLPGSPGPRTPFGPAPWRAPVPPGRTAEDRQVTPISGT